MPPDSSEVQGRRQHKYKRSEQGSRSTHSGAAAGASSKEPTQAGHDQTHRAQKLEMEILQTGWGTAASEAAS